MKIKVFVCNPFQENAYLIWDAGGNALLIDPGFYGEEEFLAADAFVKKEGLSVQRILNTHLHLDHSCGNGFVKKFWHLSAEASPKDLFLLENAERQAAMFGFDLDGTLPLPEKFLKEGDEIAVGEMRLRVLETPGHTPGGLSFYSETDGFVFVGDTLFLNSYGRTDLPGGDEQTLMTSIREKLLTLPMETAVLCGHGPATSVARERWNFGL